MNYHMIAGVLLFAGFVYAVYGLGVSNARTLYRYRNIAYAACLPALATLFFSVMADGMLPEPHTFGELLMLLPRQIAQVYIAIFLLFLLLMVASGIELMRHEGLKLKNTVGMAMPFMFLLGTVIVYLIVHKLEATAFHAENANVFLRFLFRFVPLFLYCVIDYLECMLLGIILMGWLASLRRPQYDKDFIIILGCSIRKDGGLLPLLRGRVDRALRYAWEQEIACGKPVSFVPSGGKGADEVMSEGSAMELYLLSHSAEEYEVFPEKESTNTRENFAFSKKIIDKINPRARIAFATTNYHILRSGILAWQVGIDAEGIASKTKWYFWPNGFAREAIAIFVLTKYYHFVSLGVMACFCAVVSALG